MKQKFKKCSDLLAYFKEYCNSTLSYPPQSCAVVTSSYLSYGETLNFLLHTRMPIYDQRMCRNVGSRPFGLG